MTASRTVVKGGWVVSLDAAVGDHRIADVLIEKGRITAVRPRLAVGDAEVIDARDMIVLPGFVDTHRHTFQTCIRHRYVDRPGEKYFEEVLFKLGRHYRPEDVYIGNLLGALGAIDSGITTLLDWSQVQNTPEHSDAAIAGLRDAGLRAVFAHGWPLLQPETWMGESVRGHPPDIARLRKQYFSSDEGLLTLAMAGRGPELAADGVWQADLRLARELGIRSTIHMGAFAFNGAKAAITQMHSQKLLGPDLTFVHCCCCALEEFRMMADAGVSACMGVNAEMNMQGIGDLPLDRLLAAGIRPSLSGDAETLGCSDMFTQMRLAVAYYRSWTGGGHSVAADAPTTLSSRDALEFATLAGAKATGLDRRIGSITPGKEADLILIRARDLNLTPVTDPVAAVVHGAHAGNVDTVMVAGRILKRDGRLKHADLQRALELADQSQAFLDSAA